MAKRDNPAVISGRVTLPRPVAVYESCKGLNTEEQSGTWRYLRRTNCRH